MVRGRERQRLTGRKRGGEGQDKEEKVQGLS